MLTVDALQAAFRLYYTEMEKCEKARCYWALLHVIAAIPDVCAALERPNGPVGDRYVAWCLENFPSGTGAKLLPADRYQIRNGLLHQGTTTPRHPQQYVSFSFVTPEAVDVEVHGIVSTDTARRGPNIVLSIKELAEETRKAMLNWFGVLQGDPGRNATVEANVASLVRVQAKESVVKSVKFRYDTESST